MSMYRRARIKEFIDFIYIANLDALNRFPCPKINPMLENFCFFKINYAKISRIAKNELFMSFSPQQR